MRRAEHKPLRVSYGAGAHNEGLGRLRWAIFEVKIYTSLILYKKPVI